MLTIRLCCVWRWLGQSGQRGLQGACPWSTICVCSCPGPASPAYSGNPKAMDLAVRQSIS